MRAEHEHPCGVDNLDEEPGDCVLNRVGGDAATEYSSVTVILHHEEEQDEETKVRPNISISINKILNKSVYFEKTLSLAKSV